MASLKSVVATVVRLKLILAFFSFINSVHATYTPLWAVTDWANGHATFYGGQDASGTMGGSCGYGNLYSTGYGTNTAALSGALFNNGLTCGACFQLECETDQTNWCYAGKNIIITATNLCPQGSYGGWCDEPKPHFDLSYPMFSTLAQPIGGVIPVRFKRVSCTKQGGVRFQVNGNPYFDLVLITNVAGNGNVQSVSIKGSNSGWFNMNQNWGQNWEADNHPELVGQALSFQITLGNGNNQQFWNVAGTNWQYGQTFEADYNFSW